MRIAFLGGGNMATALIGGLVARGFAVPNLSVVESNALARDRLVTAYGVHISEAADEVTRAADTLVLAVKPQDMKSALATLAPAVAGKLVISIAAGIRLATLSRWLGGHQKIVRCMPNTPALIGEGITGIFAPPGVSDEERARAEKILGAVGAHVWVAQEELLDPVTALSGSGPAYVFWFIEQLARSGEALGLPPETALKLALDTVVGSAKLAARSEDPPAVLREKVTSKGGTTEAALKVFASEKLGEGLGRALEAASRRGTELGDTLDKA
jgi:pyrroline-5-carboxylate reductase